MSNFNKHFSQTNRFIEDIKKMVKQFNLSDQETKRLTYRVILMMSHYNSDPAYQMDVEVAATKIQNGLTSIDSIETILADDESISSEIVPR